MVQVFGICPPLPTIFILQTHKISFRTAVTGNKVRHLILFPSTIYSGTHRLWLMSGCQERTVRGMNNNQDLAFKETGTDLRALYTTFWARHSDQIWIQYKNNYTHTHTRARTHSLQVQMISSTRIYCPCYGLL
jgi:hypothetical protein